MHDISKENLLRSWKEIAAHLGCDVRTCHRWEARHGMPVHRAEGGERKSPVFAYKDELDSWFRHTFRNSHGRGEKGWAGRRYLIWGAAVAATVLVLAGAIFLLRGGLVRHQPAGFSIEGSELVVLDKGGRELWRRDTGMEDLRPVEFYRANSQVINKNAGNILPSIIIKDINGDGDREVLFAPKRLSDSTGEGTLCCYDPKGAELWTFRAGRELVCGGKVYSGDYRVNGFHARDLDGDGRLETIVEAYHAPDWPCQLAVLDASGKMVGEFWNAGYLRDLVYHDLDGDGREEVIVCGVNNEYRGGCLIVFDRGRISGSSPQTGEYACEGMRGGSELYYVTVPYTDVAEAVGNRVMDIRQVDITENGRIRATSGTGVIYEFGFDLRCLQVGWGHIFMVSHESLVKSGKLSSVLDDAYGKALIKGVRWWNGSAWSAEPAKNAR